MLSVQSDLRGPDPWQVCCDSRQKQHLLLLGSNNDNMAKHMPQHMHHNLTRERKQVHKRLFFFTSQMQISSVSSVYIDHVNRIPLKTSPRHCVACFKTIAHVGKVSAVTGKTHKTGHNIHSDALLLSWLFITLSFPLTHTHAHIHKRIWVGGLGPNTVNWSQSQQGNN